MPHKLLLAALASSWLAQAGVITFDDFSVDQAPQTTTGSTTVGNRTIGLTLLGGSPPIQNSVEVNSGILDVTNGTSDDSQVVISWDVNPAIAIPAGSTNVRLTLVVVATDANPTSIQLGGLASGSFSIPGNTANETVFFPIAGPPVGPGTLTLTIDGDPGWDLALDAIGFDWTDPRPAVVPEPPSFALIGLGLAAAGLRRRK